MPPKSLMYNFICCCNLPFSIEDVKKMISCPTCSEIKTSVFQAEPRKAGTSYTKNYLWVYISWYSSRISVYIHSEVIFFHIWRIERYLVKKKKKNSCTTPYNLQGNRQVESYDGIILRTVPLGIKFHLDISQQAEVLPGYLRLFNE